MFLSGETAKSFFPIIFFPSFNIAKENGYTFLRIPVTTQMFEDADEVFITSSSGGVTQTTKCGPVSEMLMQAYEKKKVEYGTVL